MHSNSPHIHLASLAGDQYLHEEMADMSLIDTPVDTRNLL